MGQTTSATALEIDVQHQQQMPRTYGQEEDHPCVSELIHRFFGEDAARLRQSQVELQVGISLEAAVAMISAYGQPSTLLLALPPSEEEIGAASSGRNLSSSSSDSSNSSPRSTSSSRIVVDIQVSPCGLFIAVLSRWGILVYSNGQCRMLLGRCLVPRDSEVYGRLCCCCWASDSSAIFVSADPLACVCVFSIRSSSAGSSGLLQQQLQELHPQSTASTEPLTAGAAAVVAAAAVTQPAGSESWLMEGFSTAGDTRFQGDSGSISEGGSQGSEAEEEHLQPAAAENAFTAEEAIRSLPSMITAYRPPNTSPLSVSFCLLLRLPVRPSALCCSSVQRQQLLLLAGCSRQPALFWLHLGGLKQVLGCLYISDLLRVAKRAGVCPGNSGPPSAAVAASGVAYTSAARAACSGAAYQNKSTGATGGCGCSCSACAGRCCCFLEQPSLRQIRRKSSSNGTSAAAEASIGAATSPSSRQCRCLGRRRLITYLFHPKGFAAVTELLRLPLCQQDGQLLPDLPDVFLSGVAARSLGSPSPTSVGHRSAPASTRCSRLTHAMQALRTNGCDSFAECNSGNPTEDDVVGTSHFHRCDQGRKVGEPLPASTSQRQLHEGALLSSDDSSTGSVSSSRPSTTTNCNNKDSLAVKGTEAFRSSQSTGARETRADSLASAVSFWGAREGIDSNLFDGATAAAAWGPSSSSGGTSDDGVLPLGCSRLPTRGPRSARRLDLREEKRGGGKRLMHSLTDDVLSDYEALYARCCGGVRQLQLNRRLDLLAVVTAAGELLLLAWRFPIRGYTQVDELDEIGTPAKGAVNEQRPKGPLAIQRQLQQLKREVPTSATAETGTDTAKTPDLNSGSRQLSGGRCTSSNIHSPCRGCGSISIGATMDGRVAIGHSAREGFMNALSVPATGYSNSTTNKLRPWRPLGLQLRAEAVCCCALNGGRSLLAVGLESGAVEVYKLMWPRNPAQRARRSCKLQQQQTQQRQTRRTHRNVERDGFTLFPQLLHVITAPHDIMASAAQPERSGTSHSAAGAASTRGPSYLHAQSVQSMQWTADGAALAVRWLRGGAAVFSHTGSILFSLPNSTSERGAASASAGFVYPISRIFGGTQRLGRQRKYFCAREASANAATTAAAVIAGAAAGAGQLCSWIMGGLSLLHVSSSGESNARPHPDSGSPEHGNNSSFYEADPTAGGFHSEQLVEVPVLRSASVSVAASSMDVCGSRCASDLTERVMIGGSHLLVWSFVGNMRASASFSLVPPPPSLYTAKAFPVRQAALSPDGAQLLVAGSRGFALFALLHRRWRLLCMEKQEAQLPTGTLPLGWYTKDIFFVSTPAFDPYDSAASAAGAAAAPEPRSVLNAPDEAPRWLLPLGTFHRFEAAVAAAVDCCPSRFAAHVPLAIHEKTAWLQQQQQQYQQPASRLWGATGTGSGSKELSAIAAGAAARGTGGGSGSGTMWHYAVLFLSCSERLDLRCRIAEIKRLPARPHTATVLPSLHQQQLARPAASLGSRCCLCHHRSNSNGSCCMVCSGLAAFSLRSLAAGNTAEPLLAIYDALGILTAYQLQQPRLQRQQQPRQQDVVALWQLDLSDFCDSPPQQIRFVGCAWLLLVLLQSGALLLVRLGIPGSGHHAHHRIHRIPRLIVEASTVVAEGVTGLWVGAEAQLQQHYLVPSSRCCILRPQQQRQRQQNQEVGGNGVGEPAACCCSCLARATVPPRQSNRREHQQDVPHQHEPASCGLRMPEEVAVQQSSVHCSDPDRKPTLVDDKLNTCSIGRSSSSSSSSSRAAEDADVEQCKARSSLPLPRPLSSRKPAISVSHAPHSDSLHGNLSAERAAVSPPFFDGPREPNTAAAPLSPLPLQKIVDFKRPVAAVPVLSRCRTNSDLYELQLQRVQEPEPLKHLMKERYAPLLLPVLTAERSHKAGSASHQACKVSGSTPEDEGGIAANGTPEPPIRRRLQTFWAAGRRQLAEDNQTLPKGDVSIEAYARGSSPVLLCSTHSGAPLGETAGVAKPETTEPRPASAAAPTASGGFSGATLREEPCLADSQGCNGSGVDSFSAGRVPAVAAQPWEAQIENCDVCCCCIAGWHLWAQTAAGLLLASVGFHYSGTAAAAATTDIRPEHVLAVTDVRLRSALVLPVEARPHPLHIVGVIGELGVAVACTPSREAAHGFSLQTQPATQIRLLLQPCTHALLQRQLLAAVTCIPVRSSESFMLVKRRACDAVAKGLLKGFTSCTASTNSTYSNQDNCKRLFVSVSALVRELLASAFAHHLLELPQFGLLMRCISTYLKAAKWRRLQLRSDRNRLHNLLHSSAAVGVPCVGSTHRGAFEDLAESVRAAAAAALGGSSEGVALQWFLRLLQQKSPHLFVATLVFCMRKTEPLVSPAVLGSLLQRQVPPADPITLFTKCLQNGLLQTASLYLLPIQTAEGPLQVRCRRVLPLLRAALVAGDFLLVRKLLHFFWAFFRRRHHPMSARRWCTVQQQQHLADSASECLADSTLEWLPHGQPSESQLKTAFRIHTRMSHQLAHLRSLLWRPLQAEGFLDFPVAGSTGQAGADGSFHTNPWLSRVPLELPRVDRLLAARVYQEVEMAVAAAACGLLQQQKWLRLFDFATTLGLDLPAWLRVHSNGDLLQQLDQPHKRGSQKHISGTDGLTSSLTAKAQPERAGPASALATAGGTPTAARLFSEAVFSFAQQLRIGDTCVSLRLKRPFLHECSRLLVERKCKRQSPTWKDEVHVADTGAEVLKTALRHSRICTAYLVPPLCTNGNREQQATAEIARYLANVLLLSGHPAYSLALAAAVRDRDSVAQILSWYPLLRSFFQQ